jgi:autotransporter-associated beta strand protein
MSAATQNFTIASLLALGSSQTWSVASNRTLTVSGIISGATSSLTKSDAGTLAFTTATNTFGSGGGQTFTVSGGLVTAAVVSSLGSALNSVVVSDGGAIRFTATPAQTAFAVAGSGNALQAAAIFFNSSGGFASSKTITLSGASPTIGLLVSGSHAGVIAGSSSSGDVTLNLTGTPGSNAATLESAQAFSVPTGSYVVLQGVNPATGAQNATEFSIATTDAGPFGAAGNEVKVRSTVSLINRGSGAPGSAVVLSRNYWFDGEASSAAPAGTNTYSLRPFYTQGLGTFIFEGTVKGTAGNWVKSTFNTSSGATTIQFGSANGGKLDGSWNLRSFSSAQLIYLHPNLDVSTWTGALWAFNVDYGVAPTGAATYESGAEIDNISGAALTLAHSGYTLAGNLTFTGSSDMSLGGGNVTASVSPTITVSAGTLTIPGNTNVPSNLVKSGAGTLALSGSNTVPGSVTLSVGTLALDSAGSAGGIGTQFVFATGTTLDSTTGAVLNQTGAINTSAAAGSWTWKGTSSLTFGAGNVTVGGDRTIVFANGGQIGTLKFSGAITTSTSTTSWNFGGATAGAKQRVTLVGANASLAETTATNQHAVTAGYFRIENNNGLGAAATTTAWWVGATNLGVVTTKSALELAGVTTPDTKSVNLYGQGPDDDGALIGASGSSTFSGSIGVPNVAGARIGVKAGATLTLLGSGTYQNINPAVASTPLTFTAESGGTLNQNRILEANAGAVNVANGSGTVVFSRANLHTGAMTCSAGTTKLTHANAVGAAGGNNVTVTADATIEVNGVKEVFPATLTLGNSGTPAIFKISA